MFRLFYFCAFLGFLCTAVSSADAHLYFLPDYNNAVLFGTNVPHNPNTVENQCPNIGYSVTSCPAGQFLFDRCPLSALYYRTCKNNSDLCLENGYVTSCPVGRVTDEVCPEDGNYFTCKCAPCEGYNYTYAQATSAGYVVDGIGCQSCDEMKYKRKDNPCVGYNYDISNCGVSSCGNLEGETCQSGAVTKYERCTPCPVTCPSGTVNIDTYWCDSALRCLLPVDSGDDSGSCDNPAIGDILYSDKTCNANVVASKTPIGVVFDATNRLAIALNTSSMIWSTEYFDIPNLTNITSSSAATADWQGKGNTATILAYCTANSKSCPAVEYVNRYTTAGTNAGDWYLPAMGELNAIYGNKGVLNTALSKVGGTLFGSEYIWSSSESNLYSAWQQDFFDGYINYGYLKPSNNLYVRPVLAF